MSGKKVKNKTKEKSLACHDSIQDYKQKAKEGNISINDLAVMLIMSHDKLKEELKLKVSYLEQKVEKLRKGHTTLRSKSLIRKGGLDKWR